MRDYATSLATLTVFPICVAGQGFARFISDRRSVPQAGQTLIRGRSAAVDPLASCLGRPHAFEACPGANLHPLASVQNLGK